jgi:hypothetical protein
MEIERFDAMTRRMSGGGSSRRQALRVVAGAVLGGALASAAARLGLVDDAAAKAKKHRTEPKRKHKSQAEANRQGQLQVEGRRKKKRKKRDKEPKPPLPPRCQNCTECQMCQDGTCVPDPALEGVRCLESGAACGYCQGGQCAASAAPPCPDGSCPPRGQCCPGDKRCVDPESPTGFSCLGLEDCCPDQKRCGDSCILKRVCCEEERPSCGQCQEAVCKPSGAWICWGKDCGGVCVGEDECCPDQWQCADRSCVAQDECCPNERECPDGACVSEGACCSNEKLCGGECIPANQCCEAPPVCGECDVAVCDRGSWVCQPQSGCCPGGYAICSGVPQGIFWHQGRWLEGCCPMEKMIEGPACAQPWSGGSAWLCT